jgi:glycosyltransferase involved in cell wall biosynthesis
VATPNAGSREVLAAGGGILAGDAEIGSTVATLLKDTAGRETLTREARRRRGDYDLETTLDAYESLLRLLAPSRAGIHA